MPPRFVVTVAEGRFRVLERFSRPGQMEPTLRDVICHDFTPTRRAPKAYAAAPVFPTFEDLGDDAVDAAAPPISDDGDGHFWACVAELVALIEDFLIERPDEAWAYAAGPRLHNPVLERVRPSVRGGLVESVQADLAYLPSSEIFDHFKVTA